MSLTQFFASFQTCAARQRQFMDTVRGREYSIYGDLPTDQVLLRVTTTCVRPDDIGSSTDIRYYPYSEKRSNEWYDATQACLFKKNTTVIQSREGKCVFQAERVVWDAETQRWESV